MRLEIPDIVPNWINGEETHSQTQKTIKKINPATGGELCRLTRSSQEDVNAAVEAAKTAYADWSSTPAVQRGMLLHELTLKMKEYKNEIANFVALETGKSPNEALGETEGAIAQGLFFASEGQRLYGKTCTSAVPNKYAMTVRQPVGIAGLIIAANTPIANVAWKLFPALICGNATILKAAEDTPATAWIIGELAKTIGFPPGVINIVQGLGVEAGEPLVQHPDVGVISFTGSTEVGRHIAKLTAKRLAKVSLELGGKNPLIVCDDADLDNAVKWTLLSAFSNAGQRCAAAGRIIVFDNIYEEFKDKLLVETRKIKIGPTNEDFYGPVINENQLSNMLAAIDKAQGQGVRVLYGGGRLLKDPHKNGFYLEATILDNIEPDAEISKKELFGPIACLYRVKDFSEALNLANRSPYGLTACIHTKNMHRAWEFTQKVESGVAVVNAGTYGSEPHMPFGGLKQSGNGSREPGTEALDVYSELKDIYLNIDPTQL